MPLALVWGSRILASEIGMDLSQRQGHERLDGMLVQLLTVVVAQPTGAIWGRGSIVS